MFFNRFAYPSAIYHVIDRGNRLRLLERWLHAASLDATR